eukprot:g3123.t1
MSEEECKEATKANGGVFVTSGAYSDVAAGCLVCRPEGGYSCSNRYYFNKFKHSTRSCGTVTSDGDNFGCVCSKVCSTCPDGWIGSGGPKEACYKCKRSCPRSTTWTAVCKKLKLAGLSISSYDCWYPCSDSECNQGKYGHTCYSRCNNDGKITHLYFENWNLTGTIPKEIGNLPHLESLNLAHNDFNYPPPEEIIQFCKKSDDNCIGIPPGGCSAFRNAIPSIDLEKCVSCSLPWWLIIIFILLIGAMIFLVSRELDKLVEKKPGSIGGTIASITIITSHAQTMLVIANMDLSWPIEVSNAQQVLKASTLDVFSMVNLPCIYISPSSPEAHNFVLLGWFITCFCFTLIILVPIYCFYSIGDENDEKMENVRDKIYNKISMALTFLVVPLTKFALNVYFSNSKKAGAHIAYKIIFGGYFAPVFIMISFKFWREMRAMCGEWDGVCEKLALKKVDMSPERLKRRLLFLTKVGLRFINTVLSHILSKTNFSYTIFQRFAPHAPYFQFVIWAKQISILFFATVLRRHNLALGIVGFAICAISLYYHIKIQPFKYDFQNRVEKYLIITTIVMVFAATIYSEFLRPGIVQDTSYIWSWIFTFIFLILMFGSLIISSIYFRLWCKVYKSLRDMWEKDQEESIIEIGTDSIDIRNDKKIIWSQNVLKEEDDNSP